MLLLWKTEQNPRRVQELIQSHTAELGFPFRYNPTRLAIFLNCSMLSLRLVHGVPGPLNSNHKLGGVLGGLFHGPIICPAEKLLLFCSGEIITKFLL